MYRRQLQMEMERDMEMRRQQALFDHETATLLAQRQRQHDQLLMSPNQSMTQRGMAHMDPGFHLSPSAEQQLAALQRQAIERQQSADREFHEQLIIAQANARRAATPRSPVDQERTSLASEQSNKQPRVSSAKPSPKHAPKNSPKNESKAKAPTKGKKKSTSPSIDDLTEKSAKSVQEPATPVEKPKKAPENPAKAPTKSKSSEKKEKEPKPKAKAAKAPAATKKSAPKKTKVPLEKKSPALVSSNAESEPPSTLIAPTHVESTLEGLLKAMEADKARAIQENVIQQEENLQAAELMIPKLESSSDTKERVLTGTEGELVGILRILKSDDERSQDKQATVISTHLYDITQDTSYCDTNKMVPSGINQHVEEAVDAVAPAEDLQALTQPMQEFAEIQTEEQNTTIPQQQEVDFLKTSPDCDADEETGAALLGSMRKAEVSETLVVATPKSGYGGLAALIAHLEDSAPEGVLSNADEGPSSSFSDTQEYNPDAQPPLEPTSTDTAQYEYEQPISESPYETEISQAMNPTYSNEDLPLEPEQDEEMEVPDEDEESVEDMDEEKTQVSCDQEGYKDTEDVSVSDEDSIRGRVLDKALSAVNSPNQKSKRRLDVSIEDSWYPTDKAILRERRVRDYSIGSARGRNAGWRNVPPLEKRMKADPEVSL